jgi:single-strand DNA-binding protein
MLNRVFLIGRLTRDPEIRYTPNGAAVANLRLAVNERRPSRTGQAPQDETLFVDVVVWGRSAEVVQQYLRKGRRILIEGRLRLETWEGRDGQRRSRYSVVASRVQFLDAANREETVMETPEPEEEYSAGEPPVEPDLNDPPF